MDCPMSVPALRTERLLLRGLAPGDTDAADPETVTQAG